MGAEGRQIAKSGIVAFEELAYLFNSNINNRNIVRMDFNEAAMLYKYVKKCTLSVLEIGRMHGGSAILMASALTRNNQVAYTVDKDNTGLDNITKSSVRNRIQVITGMSANIAETWKEKLSLVFLDGGHSVRAVKEDVEHWSPFIVEYMILHDIRNAAAYLGLESIVEQLKDSNVWKEVDSANSLVVLQRI